MGEWLKGRTAASRQERTTKGRAHCCLGLGEGQVAGRGGEAAVDQARVAAQLDELAAVHLCAHLWPVQVERANRRDKPMVRISTANGKGA